MRKLVIRHFRAFSCKFDFLSFFVVERKTKEQNKAVKVYEILFSVAGTGRVKLEALSFAEAEKEFLAKKKDLMKKASLVGNPQEMLGVRLLANSVADQLQVIDNAEEILENLDLTMVD